MKKYKVERVAAKFSWKKSKSLELMMEERVNEMARQRYEVQSFSIDANYGGAYIIFVKE